MTLLHSLSYVGAAMAFIFVILSLASGLLWLSELIEEHSRTSKAVGQRSTYGIIILHILLYLSDSLPLKLIMFSIFCHIVYLQNFTASWPFISLSSLGFVASCVLVVLDHFFWFFYFSRITQETRHRSQRTYRSPQDSQAAPGFAEIATFFGICVWFVPLFLFLSLSANDNALPLSAENNIIPATPTSPSKPIMTRPRASLFKSLYDRMPRLRPKQRRRDTSEGIIAPRSPSLVRVPSSPTPGQSSIGLQRVPSMNSLPPPLLSPTPPLRRLSSDSYAHPPSPGMLAAGDTVFDSPQPSDRLTKFALGSPPRRVTGRPLDDRRLEMRRATSAYAGST
ncbi:Protein SVP26 [Sparassis crispa]|uniref:Protein SVP26 n=1 Tax=Sparassis crispa TaxID=139825 RepID=A0A401GCT0_9APHY|nr:Protein SVP26 [Sparassis crispa]GBE79962.1 Protein SVP26 [Sparassis crispa]